MFETAASHPSNPSGVRSPMFNPMAMVAPSDASSIRRKPAPSWEYSDSNSQVASGSVGASASQPPASLPFIPVEPLRNPFEDPRPQTPSMNDPFADPAPPQEIRPRARQAPSALLAALDFTENRLSKASTRSGGNSAQFGFAV
ncbi:hypothetical protein PM082_001032 [Marasmius tenuissimus]|nr:hypothetical protein PM082_001032 [Marasmius tenuissimus]